MNSTRQNQLAQALSHQSETITDPAGRDIAVLMDETAGQLADTHQCGVKEVYIAAMKEKILPHRYLRNYNTFSIEDQLQLAQSRVSVVGSGGLGGHISLTLARIGIGHLTIVDCDVFDESNLNRQAFSNSETIGTVKSEAAAAAILRINPAVEVTAYNQKIDADNAADMLNHSDVIVDALDNIDSRFVVEAAAKKLKIPMVHGALAGFEGQVMTIFPDDVGLTQLYGEKETRKQRTQKPEAILGVPTPTPTVVAVLEAMEVLKIILNRENVLRNKMLHIDLETGQLNTFHFKT
jgi:molybdopterin/thiamine biosynthesis adenylyltransferase